MHRDHGAEGNGILLQARRRGPEGRRQCDVPHFAIGGFDPHRAMRAGKLHAFGDHAGHRSDFIDITAPAVMGEYGGSRCEGDRSTQEKKTEPHDFTSTLTVLWPIHPSTTAFAAPQGEDGSDFLFRFALSLA